MSNQNTSKLDIGNCSRCGRSKRLSKLKMTKIGWCCKRCAAVISDVYGEDSTL